MALRYSLHRPSPSLWGRLARESPPLSINLRLFVEHGLLREVSPRASTLLVEGNLEPHHHLVCTRCKAVQDIEGDFINFKKLSRQAPRGFDLTQPLVEVFGLCRQCAKS